MKKTFKIGEYAIGGIIAVEINGGAVTISAKDWDTKNTIMSESYSTDRLFEAEMYLNELTSCYYADKVMNFIKSNS